jgi:hypothetical protein
MTATYVRSAILSGILGSFLIGPAAAGSAIVSKVLGALR